ncbi:MAG: methyltransferase domain-containing protein [Ferruginibacter sp.]|nr:methyltransferase domain-containing protein [Ferruginibacter sp.]
MESIRKPYQGVWNIIRFNWHFYVIAACSIVLLWVLANMFPSLAFYFLLAIAFIVLPTIISLLTSFYVYDVSNLYSFNWIKNSDEPITIVNINAGFDETSSLLSKKFKNAKLYVFDFYDSSKHTEISIERARKAYSKYPNTQQIVTHKIPLENESVDNFFLIFAAHEIRNNEERNIFFKEVNRVLKDNGEVIVVEHLRDVTNFLAYNIGFFHFLSKHKWLATFTNADFAIAKQIKHTPFITSFTLTKYANTF